MFFQRKDKFYTLLLDCSANLKACAEYFAKTTIHNQRDNTALLKKITSFRDTGESCFKEVSMELQHAFITPLEREDILHLADYLYIVLKKITRTCNLIEMYSIMTDQYVIKFKKIIEECVIEIDLALKLITENKLLQINTHVHAIKALEAESEVILRSSIRQLNKHEKNPILFIKYKEIYESLGHIIDSCQGVATTFETIVIKNC